MSELTKAKRRIRRLEKCLEAVRDLVCEEWERVNRFTVADEEETKRLDRIINRINRTL